MRRCSVKPYEGNEGYVFISYSHGDKDRVYPILERMAADGCRLWYDEGITPGEEWPEAIGRHLSDCSAFISFVSKRSADSDNCRREIIFAQRKHKPFFSVILEEFELSPGLEMQLSAYQSLYMYLLRDEDEFFEKFYKTDFADSFRTVPTEQEKAPVPEPAVQEKPAAPAPKAPKPSPKGKIIAAAAAAAVLVGGGIAALVLNSGKDKVPESSAEVRAADVSASESRAEVSSAAESSSSSPDVSSAVSAESKKEDSYAAGSISSEAGDADEKTEGTGLSVDGRMFTAKKTVITADSFRKLSENTNLKFVKIESCTFEEGVSFADLPETVTELDISDCTGISSLKGLDKLTSLDTLKISGCSITDSMMSETDLSSLEKLSIADLSRNSGLTDLSPILKVSELRSLGISGTGISSLEGIGALEKLNTLNASSCGITDAAPVRELEGLEYLSLDDNTINSISALDGLTELRGISVKRCGLTSLSGLEHSLVLRELYASGNSIADLEGIANCTKLTLLALNGNELTDAGVLKKSSSSLKSADLRNNKLKDLSFITDAPDLSLLYADGNMIEDISALRGAPGLVTFTAAHNRIGDISPLSGCAKLRILVLSDNAVSDASALAGLPDTGDKMLKVMLGNNSLTGIDLGDKEINVLYISGNPISGGALNCGKCRYLFAGYSEDMDPEKLFAGDKISHMYLSGCPLDRQVEFKQASRSAMVTLEFVETGQELTELADQFFSQYASGGIDAFSLTGRDG